MTGGALVVLTTSITPIKLLHAPLDPYRAAAVGAMSLARAGSQVLWGTSICPYKITTPLGAHVSRNKCHTSPSELINNSN